MKMKKLEKKFFIYCIENLKSVPTECITEKETIDSYDLSFVDDKTFKDIILDFLLLKCKKDVYKYNDLCKIIMKWSQKRNFLFVSKFDYSLGEVEELLKYGYFDFGSISWGDQLYLLKLIPIDILENNCILTMQLFNSVEEVLKILYI